MVIKTRAELLQWLEGHPQRHARRGDGGYSCGWPERVGFRPEDAGALGVPGGVRNPTFEDHSEHVLVADLGDVLASDTHDTNDERGSVPWRELADGLYATIDQLHRELDAAQA